MINPRKFPKEKEKEGNSAIVYQYLQGQMSEGLLLPGSVVDQKGLAQKLGMSNTPLRDSLIRLEAEGYLTIYPRSKVVVNSLELSDFPYLYAVMATLEFTAISNSLNSYTKAILNRAAKLNREMESALEDGDMISYDKAHYSFHDIFFEVSPNLFAERIIQPIRNRLWDFPRKNFAKDWYKEAIKEHDKILEAIKLKDITMLQQAVIVEHWGYEYNKESIKKAYNLS